MKTSIFILMFLIAVPISAMNLESQISALAQERTPEATHKAIELIKQKNQEIEKVYKIASSEDQKALGNAIFWRNYDRVKALLESKKADPNMPFLLQDQNGAEFRGHGYVTFRKWKYSYPLRAAIQNIATFVTGVSEDRFKIPQLLLDHGARINDGYRAQRLNPYRTGISPYDYSSNALGFTLDLHFHQPDALSIKDRIEVPVIMHAVFGDDQALFDWLVGQGAVVPDDETLKEIDKENLTALYHRSRAMMEQYKRGLQGKQGKVGEHFQGTLPKGVIGIINGYMS